MYLVITTKKNGGIIIVASIRKNNAQKKVAVSNETNFDFPCGYTDSEGVRHKTFTVREMDGKDEEALSRKDLASNTAKMMNVLLSRCVTSIGTLTPEGMGAKEWENVIKGLYVGDQDVAILKIREVSIGGTLTFNSECPVCGRPLTTEVDVDEIPVIEFKGEEKIPFSLPSGYSDKNGELHKEGTIRLPKGADREILVPIGVQNSARARTMMLTRLVEFNDGTFVSPEIMSSLSIRDRKYLNDLLEENLFGIDTDVPVICTECGAETKVSFNASNFM